MYDVIVMTVMQSATSAHCDASKASPPCCELVWFLSKGSPLSQHTAVAVYVQALPTWVTIGQASKVLCLDPCRQGKQLGTGVTCSVAG